MTHIVPPNLVNFWSLYHGLCDHQANKMSNKNSGIKYILCQYHSRFGANARRCEKYVNGQPCAMVQEQPPVMDSTSKPTVSSAGHITQPIRKTGTIVVSEILSGRYFLIDTGAEESVYPASRQKNCGPSLIAANGTNCSQTYLPMEKRSCLTAWEKCYIHTGILGG